MSFRKRSFSKSDKKSASLENPIKPFELLFKIFSRNSTEVSHKRNESFSYSTKRDVPKTNSESEFLWNLELVLIYTASLIRQKIDDLNRVNLIQQFLQCSQFIDTHLKESQTFVNHLNSDMPEIQNIKCSMENFKITHEGFFTWIENVSLSKEDFEPNICQDLFFNMEVKAQIFIEKLKSGLNNADKEYKRSSIDNSSLISASLRSMDSGNSRKSRFNDEDRKLIDKLKKFEHHIDIPPPKPAVPKVDQENLDSYLDQIEEVIKSQRESEYDYETITNNNEMKSVKIENNCIMASSMISNEIPPADMDSTDDFTPTPNVSNPGNNGFNFNNADFEPVSIVEKSRNFPLPPVPGKGKITTRYKTQSKINSNFPSEEIHYRKTSMKESDRSQVTNGSILNFNHRSPLRSPAMISSINSQNLRSPLTNLPIVPNHRHSNSSILSPSTFSSKSQERTDFHNFNSSHHLLMAKQIPSIVDDPNDLLNINDMQNDIEIITRSFDAFNVDEKKSNRLSDLSDQTNLSLKSEPPRVNSNSLKLDSNNDAVCNSEVKSDTEEYFEYFEIDGRKYRRKMKKRTVIEKIKIRKTVLAPMKADGSGPDFSSLKIDDDQKDLLDSESTNNEQICLMKNNLSSVENPQPRFRRGNEDRFRVSKSMFYPNVDQSKRMTLCHSSNTKGDQNNTLYPLMNKYMYKFGQSDFEEPVIDKRFSTQLTDAVYSTWIKTSESILPHEKSKSICFLKKTRQTNLDGATVHNAIRVTASRTIRMKVSDDVNKESQTMKTPIPGLMISSNTDEEESVLDDDDSDTSLCITDTSICGTDTRNSQVDSSLISSDDEKYDEDSPFHSDSITSEQDIRQSKESAISSISFSDDGLSEDTVQFELTSSDRNYSPDSCYNSSRFSSNYSDVKEQHSFILTVNNATQYLIFDEDPKFGECDIAGGPVDALIVYACDGKEHLLFLGAFLDTYRTFIEPYELVSRLIIRYKFYRNFMSKQKERFSDDQTIDPEDNPDKKCKHVLSLLLTIIGKLKNDLTDELNEQIEEFKKYLLEIKQSQWVEAISRAIRNMKQCLEKDDKIAERLEQISNQYLVQNDQKSPTREFGSQSKILMGINSSKSTILNFSSRTIAEQMTLLDWCKYRKVELMEILNLKDIVHCNLPGVINYAKNFENVQYWTQSILLDSDRISDKDKLCTKFLHIMKHLQRLNNYSSLIAILLGIQLLPTEKLFSKRVRSKIKEYDNYMKPPRFAGYKEDLKQAVAPCIPFLGIFYQDIVMLNIANPPYLDLDDIIRSTAHNNFSSNSKQVLLSNSASCGRIINFWRSFKQYVFLKNCNKDQDKIRYSIEPNEKILHFLNNYKDSFDELTIQKLIKQPV